MNDELVVLETLPLCACGCGKTVSRLGNVFMQGHRKKKGWSICLCGCGKQVNSRQAKYIMGHQIRGKLGHNYGNRYTIRKDCPKKLIGLTEEHKKKIGLKSKGHITSEHQKELLRKVMRGNKKCASYSFTGKRHKEQAKVIIGLKSRGRCAGEKNHWWRGGLFEPYTKEFNKQLKIFIRMRDGFTCQLCGMPESEDIRQLSCHHIDYDKKNAMPNNLISLCTACHVRTNENRHYWTAYFRDILNKRQLNPKALVKKRKVNIPKVEEKPQESLKLNMEVI